MLTAGICFIIGAILTASAYQLPQLVVGRIVLGAGVGEVFQQSQYISRSILSVCMSKKTNGFTVGYLGVNLKFDEWLTMLVRIMYIRFDAPWAWYMAQCQGLYHIESVH